MVIIDRGAVSEMSLENRGFSCKARKGQGGIRTHE